MRFDYIIIGGGQGDALLGRELLSKGKSCALICQGRQSGDNSREAFRKAGGCLFMGDSVDKVFYSEDGSRIEALCTENLGSGSLLVADTYILCSGRFFTRGLCSDMDKIYEPVFGADVQFEADPSLWCRSDFFCRQPFEDFGLVCDEGFHALKNGKHIENLIVAGDILCNGQNNIESLCKSL